MSPAPDLEGDDGCSLFTPPPRRSPSTLVQSSKKNSPTTSSAQTPTTPMVGGCRRSSPKSFRKTPKPKRWTKANDEATPSYASCSNTNINANASVKNDDNMVKVNVKSEACFQDHKELCKRVAKSLYFANKLPTTPRPSLPLTKLAVSTFSKKARQDTLEFLDLEQAAEIGRNACVTPTALIMAIVYLERLSLNNPGYLGSVKPSELFVVSLLVASKFIQDDGEALGIFNDEWATSGHFELKKLNRLEISFLTAIDWKVKVNPDEYNKVLEWLEQEVAIAEGTRRGWFTYSEVTTLLSFHLLWPTIYQQCVQVIAAACMTYATLLATMVTSTMLGPQIFMLSKTCLTALTTGQTLTYQPFLQNANNSTIAFHVDQCGHKNNKGSLFTDHSEEMTNLDEAEVQLGSLLGFGNETDVFGYGNFLPHGRTWARPGQRHDQHSVTATTNYKPTDKYGLNLELMFTQEVGKVFGNHNAKGRKTDTDGGECPCTRQFEIEDDDGQDHMRKTNLGRCSNSGLKNHRFSLYGQSLPDAKFIRV